MPVRYRHCNNTAVLYHTCIRVNKARWPKENTSSFGPYEAVFSNACGGIYTTAPGTRVNDLASFSGSTVTIRELPRSLILATMAEFNRTFLAERSLWIMGGLWLWRYTSPFATSARMDLLMARGMSGVFSSKSSRLVSSSSIISTGREDSPKKHRPMNCTMWGCLRLERS